MERTTRKLEIGAVRGTLEELVYEDFGLGEMNLTEEVSGAFCSAMSLCVTVIGNVNHCSQYNTSKWAVQIKSELMSALLLICVVLFCIVLCCCFGLRFVVLFTLVFVLFSWGWGGCSLFKSNTNVLNCLYFKANLHMNVH